MAVTTLCQASHKLHWHLLKYSRSYNVDLVSLNGLNNLRKLKYDIHKASLSRVWQQLQTISFSFISEVNFIYTHLETGDDSYRYWGNIDTLMADKFSALSVVTIEWRVSTGISEERVTWNHCLSQSIAALPKLHQKGILRPVIPPQAYLK